MPPLTGGRILIFGVVTLFGGVAFLTSMAWTAHAYLREFAVLPPAWSTTAGLSAIAINAGWFGLFAAHHSLFARAPVKSRIVALVSAELERSAYVWVSSLLLALVVWQWEAVPGTAWQVTGPPTGLLAALQLAGVGVTLHAASQLGFRDLAGLKPPRDTPPALRQAGLYGFVRHPIYFAWLLMVWPTPVMTGSRLTFAVLTTVYLVVAVRLEERSLRTLFGPAYDQYRKVVRWRMLPGVY